MITPVASFHYTVSTGHYIRWSLC